MTITPEQLARSSEHSHQSALFCWAASFGISELKWLFAIPNGFYATPAQKAKMKAEGLRSGISDVMLPVMAPVSDNNSKSICQPWYNGLFIEIKTEAKRNTKNGGLSDEQIIFGRFVASQGYKFVVAYSWTEARDAILNYLGKGVNSAIAIDQ